MANQEHVVLLRQGVEVWNGWRKQYRGIRPDLTSANLSGITLSGANLSDVNLSFADLSDAHLNFADLRSAELDGSNLSSAVLIHANCSFANLIFTDLSSTNFSSANLSDANLDSANLDNANLSGADLSFADLSFADLGNTKLSGANFNEARVGGTVFRGLDLRDTRGLETMKHTQPSTIGTDTLERSHGEIPDIFLRGAGLSDIFLAYVRMYQQHMNVKTESR